LVENSEGKAPKRTPKISRGGGAGERDKTSKLHIPLRRTERKMELLMGKSQPYWRYYILYSF
jgi:hypothetical protein